MPTCALCGDSKDVSEFGINGKALCIAIVVRVGQHMRFGITMPQNRSALRQRLTITVATRKHIGVR